MYVFYRLMCIEFGYFAIIILVATQSMLLDIFDPILNNLPLVVSQ